MQATDYSTKAACARIQLYTVGTCELDVYRVRHNSNTQWEVSGRIGCA